MSCGTQAVGNTRELEERAMIEVRNRHVTLYVDWTSQQWVVLDMDGNFWMLPNVENPWDQRQLIYPTEESELEPVPGHYKHMLGLPIN